MAAMYEIDLASCGPLRAIIEARPAKWLHAAFVGAVALVLAAGAWTWLCKIDVVVAAPGRLRPTTSPIAVSAIGGASRVAEVRVVAGQSVVAGDILAVLDTRALTLEVTELRGTIASRQAEQSLLRALGDHQAEQVEAERARTRAEIEQASHSHVRDDRTRRIDLSRTSKALAQVREREAEAARLFAGGHASREELAALRREREALEADARKLQLGQAPPVEVLERSLEVISRSADVEGLNLEVRIQSLQQSLDLAGSELAKREFAMAEATLRAPIDGVVSESRVEVGSSIEANGTAFVIVPDDGYFFEGVVNSADAGHLALGMLARVEIDTFDPRKYGMIEGTIAYVSADSAAGDTEGPGYVVRVEVPTDVIGHGNQVARLRLGLGGRLRVVVGRERVLSLLLADLEDRVGVEWSP